MKLNTSVTVQNQSSSYTVESMASVVWTASQTLEMSNHQPVSGEIAYKEYGISGGGIVDVFFFKTSTTAQEGGRIVDGSDTYDIYRIKKYPNHYEAIAKRVVS